MATIVLILVVVDNGLVQTKNYGTNFSRSVLILVVVDNGLVLFATALCQLDK